MVHKYIWGRRVIGISGFLIWSNILMKLIFNPCGEFRWSPEGPVGKIHSPYLHDGASGSFSYLLKSVHTLKREWCAESNGKLPHLFILSKTVTLVHGFAQSKTCLWTELQPRFLSLQWKTCHWAELHTWCLNFLWRTFPWAEQLWYIDYIYRGWKGNKDHYCKWLFMLYGTKMSLQLFFLF